MNLSIMPVSNNKYSNQNNNLNFKKIAKTKQAAAEFIKCINRASVNDADGMQKFLLRMMEGIIGTSALLPALFCYDNKRNEFMLRIGYPGSDSVDYDVKINDENSLYTVEQRFDIYEKNMKYLNKIPNAHRWNFTRVLAKLAKPAGNKNQEHNDINLKETKTEYTSDVGCFTLGGGGIEFNEG